MMKNIMVLFSTTLLVVEVVCAKEVLKCDRNAQAKFCDAGVVVQPSGFLPGWSVVNCVGDRSVADEDVVPFKMDWRTAKGMGTASFLPLPGGKVSARWFMTVDGSIKVEQLFLRVNIPFDKFDGGAYEYDGRRYPFPKVGSNFHFGFAKGIRTVSLIGKDGKTRCDMVLDGRRDVFMQDNSCFGGGFELRVKDPATTLAPGEMYRFGVMLSSSSGLSLSAPAPVRIAAGRDWVPIRHSVAVQPGSALDFSGVGGTDTPAGKYGRVKAEGGHFAFERKPGVPQRFYGVNLCFSANFHQTREEAGCFAEKLARMGYNALRIHHHDGGLVQGSPDGTTINPARMRELDALAAAMYAKGIYLTTDLYVSRSVPYRECGVDRDGNFEMGEFKEAVRTNVLAQANLKRFARAWLTHVNEFTGRRWADEPGLAWISLVNENCPDNGVRLDAAARTAMIKAENAFFSDMRRFIREEVGSSVLLTDLNGWSMNPQWSPSREEFDYVDMHFYVDHPRFLERGWCLPSECDNVNPVRGEHPARVLQAEKCRVRGKPFAVSEWDFAAPGFYRGVGGMLVGAWAAKHDWDAIWRFAWSHDIEGVRSPERKEMNYFNLSADPVSLASEWAAICLFLRRDLKPGAADALRIDGEKGLLAVNTPCTCGVFADGGSVSAGVLTVDMGDKPAMFWASSLDGKPLNVARRILFVHLTDVQNSGAVFEDGTLCVLKHWGTLPLLMRNADAVVELHVKPGSFSIYALDVSGNRKTAIPSQCSEGTLRFHAVIGRDPSAASYLYEIVRK